MPDINNILQLSSSIIMTQWRVIISREQKRERQHNNGTNVAYKDKR